MSDWILFGLCGGAAGLINGFFGAGGGVLLVALLLHAVKLDDHKAFATSLSIMLPLTVVSIIVHMVQGHTLLSEAIPYLIGGLLGGLIGGKLFEKIPSRLLHLIFGLIIFGGGVKLLWQAFPF